MKLSEFYEKYGDQNIDEKELKEFLGIKEHKHFKPKNGETYFYVSVQGAIHQYDWHDDETDYTLYENTNLYRAQEEAKFARDKNQLLLKMQRDFEDNSDVIDWNDNRQLKYSILYAHNDEEVFVEWSSKHQYSSLYTTNRKWLHQYIKDNEDNIKKYYFEIKERQK